MKRFLPILIVLTALFVNQNTLAQYKTNSTSAQNTSAKKKIWRENLGYGMFAINEGIPNGARTEKVYRPCTTCNGTTNCCMCKGTKICPLCYGLGGTSVSYDMFIPCSFCGQSGMCTYCNRTGKCFCAKSEYPGYFCCMVTTFGAKGEILFTGSVPTSSSSSSSSSSRTSSSKSTQSSSCYVCHGTGVDPSPSSTNAANWIAYVNRDCVVCPYCKRVDHHQHARCYHCNVPTHY